MRVALTALVLCLAGAQGADAQAPSSDKPSPYRSPRTSDGFPDLQGHWTNTSLTSLERQRDFTKLVLSEEEAQRVAQARNASSARDSQPTDPKSPAPRAGNVGGYNAFWIDTGTSFAKVNGEYRSSWIVEPADGKVPYNENGRKLFSASLNSQRNETSDPEARSLGERCLLGFGSSSGPPMLNVSYNNHYQIVQTPGTVVLYSEMIHDARIVRMNAQHLPSSMRKWMGDSIGRWDGNTLVVETINMHPQESMRVFYGQSLYVSEKANIVERFTRVSDAQLLYRFEIDDPSVYARPWSAEMVFNSTEEKSFEYACHEGNYSMPGILAGGRRDERSGR